MNKKNIESCHSGTIHNIDVIERCFCLIRDDNLLPNGVIYQSRYDRMIDVVDSMKSDYTTGVLGILSNYYREHNEEVANAYFVFTNEYQKKINQCIEYIRVINEYKYNTELSGELKKINCIPMIDTINTKYDNCVCGNIMNTMPLTSELVCPICGLSIQLNGIVFGHSQFYNQDSGSVKPGNCVASKHSKYWIHCIQATERIDIPGDAIDKISGCIIRDNINRNRLMCFHIRRYLKELELTEFNDHIPYIRSKIIGYTPPQLTLYELRVLNSILDKCISIYERIGTSHKSNKKYPYIIYKILDHILDKGDRKNKIMECIYLQGSKTLISSDITWEEVCKCLDDIKFIPTDRSIVFDIITN